MNDAFEYLKRIRREREAAEQKRLEGAVARSDGTVVGFIIDDRYVMTWPERVWTENDMLRDAGLR